MTDILNATNLARKFPDHPRIDLWLQLALGALGVTLVYGVLRFSNFAHGETMAFGAMITILVTWGLQSVGVSIKPLPTALIAIPIGIVVTVILTLAIDKVVYRYHRERRANPVIFLIVSIGVMFLWVVLSASSSALVTKSFLTELALYSSSGIQTDDGSQ